MTSQPRCGRAAASVLVLIWINSVIASGVAYVSAHNGTLGLKPALQSDAETVVLLGNYSVNHEFDEYTDAPLRINRNVTITSQPGQLPVLDLTSSPGVWELCSTCMLRFLRVSIANETNGGTGSIISIVRGQGGSRVEHLNSYGLRLACTETESALAIINRTRRSALYPAPGDEQRTAVVDVTYEGRTYTNMLLAADISSDIPLQLVAGNHFVGGYAVHRRNATRLCQHVVSDDCIRNETPELCIKELTASLLGGPSGAAAAGGNSHTAAIAAPVAVGGALLLAALAAALVLRRRRSRRHRPQLVPLRLPLSKADADVALPAVDSATGPDPGSDQEKKSSFVFSQPQLPQQQLAGSDPLVREVGMGSGTAAGSFLLSGPAAVTSASSMGSGHIASAVLGPAAGGSGVWEMSWCRTAPSMEWAAQDTHIELGPLLGAGSFARVFKAKWAGLDVAVKVISHDTSTLEVVANEVQLMMQLNHPNIVRAYHCTTKQHKQPQHELGSKQQQAAVPGASRAGSSCGGRGSAYNSAGSAAGGGTRGSSSVPRSGPSSSNSQQQQQQQQQQQSIMVPGAAVPQRGSARTPATPPTPPIGLQPHTGASSIVIASPQAPASAAVTAGWGSGVSRSVLASLSVHGGPTPHGGSAGGAPLQPLQQLLVREGQQQGSGTGAGAADAAAAAARQLVHLEAAAAQEAAAGAADLGSNRSAASLHTADPVGGTSGQQAAAAVGMQRPQLGTARAVYAGDVGHNGDGSGECALKARPVSLMRALHGDTSSRAPPPPAASGDFAGFEQQQQQQQQQRAAIRAPASSRRGDDERDSAAASRQPRRHSAPSPAAAPAPAPASPRTATPAAVAAAATQHLPSADTSTGAVVPRRCSLDHVSKQQAVPQGALAAGVTAAGVTDTVTDSVAVGVQDLDAGRPTARSRDPQLGTTRALYAPASFASSSSGGSQPAAAAAARPSAAQHSSPHARPLPPPAAVTAAPASAPEGSMTPGSSGSQAWPVIERSSLLESGWTGDGTGGARDATDKGEVGLLCETWLVTELCDRGTLARVASDWQPQANEEDVLQLLLLLQDVARGLKLLHTNNIVHADLNSHNVLVSSSSTAQYGLVAKIADLGLSRVIKQQATHRTTRTVGTLSHQPPELLQDGRSSPAVDIYSYGIMMHELYTGEAAFCRMRYGQIYNQVVLLGARPSVQPDMPDDYQLLMKRCWSADPLQRPSVDMLLDCLALMVQDRQQTSHESV